MLARLDRLTALQASVVLVLAGLVAFASGMSYPFQGDDIYQIVNAPPVHSIANLGTFFSGGTFDYNNGSTLSGGFYRPLTVTSYALLYTLFGANPVPFHLFQLALAIAGSVLLFLFLRYSMRAPVALAVALTFLVHPVNSQNVFNIPALPNPLYFVFGMAALWLLVRSRSDVALIPVVVLLFLALLAKESGVLFIGMATIYLFVFGRRRLWPFLGFIAIPLLVYAALRLHAVGGVNVNYNNAPIDRVGVGGRMLTLPSIWLFYIGKLVLPLGLAKHFYWVTSSPDLGTFFLPLAVDIAVVALFVYLERLVRRHGTAAQRRTYIFFAAWALLGMALYSQVIPLEMTASEAWAQFPMAGVLGMLGIALSVMVPVWRIDRRTVVAVVALAVVLLGARSVARGYELGADPFTLAQRELAVSTDDFDAETQVAYAQARLGDLAAARQHADHAVSVFPTAVTYVTLGQVLLQGDDYAGAHRAFTTALTYDPENQLAYENLGILTVWYGDYAANRQLLSQALALFPTDADLWLDLAILDENHGHNADARTEMATAIGYGANAPYTAAQIQAGKPVTVVGTHPALQ